MLTTPAEQIVFYLLLSSLFLLLIVCIMWFLTAHEGWTTRFMCKTGYLSNPYNHYHCSNQGPSGLRESSAYSKHGRKHCW
jgi:hypothetical protein